MPAETAVGTMAYLCECGKKWSIPKKGTNKSFKCDCGRVIVVEDGIIYSTNKAERSAK